MRIPETVQDGDTALVYAGLGRISGRGREILKCIARSLVLAQNNAGYPLPEGIVRQIRRGPGTAGAGGGGPGREARG